MKSFALGTLGFAALAMTLGSCGDDSNDAAATAGAPSAALDGSSWVLASATINNASVDAVATASLDFGSDGRTLNGTTGCNNFGGTYKQTGHDLQITLGPMTLAACTDPAVTAQEEAIVRSLPKVASFDSGVQMTLRDSSGKTLLVYNHGVAGLAGTSWKATGVNNGKGAVESTTLTESLTAVFGADGSLSGFAGCNQYNATYDATGSQLTISAVSTTRKACDEAAMTLESQFVTALGNVAVYQISGTTLTLRDSSGATQITLTTAT